MKKYYCDLYRDDICLAENLLLEIDEIPVPDDTIQPEIRVPLHLPENYTELDLIYNFDHPLYLLLHNDKKVYFKIRGAVSEVSEVNILNVV
jgi:hypothetical protein